MMKFFLVSLMALSLSACTEIQFISHVFKNAEPGETETASISAPATQSQGTFKVGKPYTIMGRTYYPKESYDLVETGIASWYGPGFHGGRTASGERFDSSELTAAHRTLQMPSLVRVTNLDNGRSVVVRVNDRGPFARGRVMDVSSKAADLLDFKGHGTAKVRLEVLPQESLRIAEMAKRGQNTRNLDLAALRAVNPTAAVQVAALDPALPIGASVAPVSPEALADAMPVPLHQTQDGRYLPDPVVTQLPVQATNIYIQAGAFSVQANAEKMRQTLSKIGTATVREITVNGKRLYRVRVGPVRDVQSADKILNRVIASGNSRAIIVVD